MAGLAALLTTCGIDLEKTTFNPLSTIFQPMMSRVSGQITDDSGFYGNSTLPFASASLRP